MVEICQQSERKLELLGCRMQEIKFDTSGLGIMNNASPLHKQFSFVLPEPFVS